MKTLTTLAVSYRADLTENPPSRRRRRRRLPCTSGFRRYRQITLMDVCCQWWRLHRDVCYISRSGCKPGRQGGPLERRALQDARIDAQDPSQFNLCPGISCAGRQRLSDTLTALTWREFEGASGLATPRARWSS
jgi:hypothetical protein